jgi:hypothetical protein
MPRRSMTHDPDKAMCLALLGLFWLMLSWDLVVISLERWEWTVSSVSLTAASHNVVAAAMLGLIPAFVVGHLVSGDAGVYPAPSMPPICTAMVAMNAGVPLGWWLWSQ